MQNDADAVALRELSQVRDGRRVFAKRGGRPGILFLVGVGGSPAVGALREERERRGEKNAEMGQNSAHSSPSATT
jgi:hypothetical protein